MSEFFSGLISAITPVRGSGNVVEDTRELEPFHGVVLQTIGSLAIQFGDQEKILMRGEDNILPLLETVVEDGLLKIRFQPGTSVSTRRDVDYTLTVKQVDRVETTSSGDIDLPAVKTSSLTLVSKGSGDIVTGNIQAEKLVSQQHSAGKIELAGVQCGALHAEIKGSGNLRVDSGSVKTLELRMTSAGRCEAANLSFTEEAAEHAQIEITGSGDAEIGGVRALETRVRLTSAGNLTLGKLETDRLAAKVSGSGDLTILDGTVKTQNVELVSAGKYLAHDVRAADQAAEAFIKVSGSGNAFPGVLKAVRTDLQLSSSGHVSIRNLETDHLQAAVKGSGNLKIENGRARSLDLELTSAGGYSGDGVGAAEKAGETTSVRVSGSGSARLGGLNAQDIHLSASSAGDLRVANLVTDMLKGEVKGSGHIKIHGGEARQADIRISSSGDFQAYDLAIQRAEVRSSGSGNVKLQAQERLDVKISSAGNVSYRGKPIVSYAREGSGEIKKSSSQT